MSITYYWKEVKVKDPLTGEERIERHPCVRCENCGTLVDTMQSHYYIVEGKPVCPRCYVPGKKFPWQYGTRR